MTLDDLYQYARDWPGVGRGKALQNQGLMVDGKLFAFLKGEQLILKLPAKTIDDLIVSHDAIRFERGQGKPMREWICLPAHVTSAWPDLTKQAYDFLALQAKLSRKS